MSDKHVLIVGGHYDFTRAVLDALPNTHAELSYSHSDALYSLDHHPYDAVILDARMVDRRSGEVTLHTIAHTDQCPPIIACYPAPPLPPSDHLPLVLYLPELTADGLRHALDQIASHRAQDNATLPRRPDHLQTLFALGKSLTEVLDLTEVLNRVVEAARYLTNADESMILLPDEDGGEELYLRARTGMDGETARNFRVKTVDNYAGIVYQSGQAVMVGARGPQRLKTQYFVNALLYVPILVRGRAIGVLGVNNRLREDPFTQAHQELLINLATYAAIAIENARIHQDSVRRAEELTALVQASQIVNASITLDQHLPTVTEQLLRVLNVNTVYIGYWSGGELSIMARREQAVWLHTPYPQVALHGQADLIAALKRNRPVWQTAANTPALQDLGVWAAWFKPIYLQGQVCCVLHAFYSRNAEQPPTDAQAQAAHTLALEVFGALRHPHSHATIIALAEKINATLGSAWIEISQPQTMQQLDVRARVGDAAWPTFPRPSVTYDELTHAHHKLDAQGYLSLTRETPHAANGLLDLLHCHTLLAVPFMQRGQIQGVVLFGDTERAHAFDKRELEIARGLVAQSITALENAQLFHELQLRLQELKETQNRLVQTARLSAMGELAAAVAHQINNPLATIVTDAELVLSDLPKDSRMRNSLEAIQRAGKRAGGVVRRLLAVARANGEADATTYPIDVIDSIRGTISLVKSHLDRSQVRLNANLTDESLPPVFAAPGQLDDIWLNLILNAHDALVNAGTAQPAVTIDVVYNQVNQLQVTIRDNGPGVPEHLRDNIFKPFFTTKPPGEGTGLGLHICRQVTEQVGGTIELASHGRGATFIVNLPAYPNIRRM
jgi:signal transduction histidine kinase